MTVCKCGKRWETRDSTDEEFYYGICEDCIKKARERGEIPPKTDNGLLIEAILKGICKNDV